MSRFEFKLPDLGEGTIEAEIVEWKVKAGDRVTEEDVIVDVMTDKANIDLPSPVTGTVVATNGEPGDVIAVGATLIVFETDAAVPVAAKAEPKPAATVTKDEPARAAARSKQAARSAAKVTTAESTKRSTDAANDRGEDSKPASQDGVLTSPSTRRRAREAGIDLNSVDGSGPGGRITNEDFEGYLSRQRERPRAAASKATSKPSAAPANSAEDIEELKVIGVRRVIAQRLSEAKRTIPHFAYVEEIDITELESLRTHLNEKHDENLTYLPFLALALVRVLPEFPQCNAHYDAERGVLLRHRRVHMGVATQTPDGLKVPVVHDAQALTVWQLAQQIRRVSEAARNGTAKKDELTGSTITITSLGRLGGIASTPIINAPEVGIIGVNKAVQRPMVMAGTVAIRLMMNLSASFDHRFVDGYDAAALIQAVKDRLEHPATIFIDG